jgi:hypothetical protein
MLVLFCTSYADAGSLSFLASHNFDFNRWVCDGVEQLLHSLSSAWAGLYVLAMCPSLAICCALP